MKKWERVLLFHREDHGYMYINDAPKLNWACDIIPRINDRIMISKEEVRIILAKLYKEGSEGIVEIVEEVRRINKDKNMPIDTIANILIWDYSYNVLTVKEIGYRTPNKTIYIYVEGKDENLL